MTPIPRFYAGIFTFLGTAIRHGNVFPEIRRHRQQDLLGDETLVSLRKFWQDCLKYQMAF